jgi:hypothetical protein
LCACVCGGVQVRGCACLALQSLLPAVSPVLSSGAMPGPAPSLSAAVSAASVSAAAVGAGGGRSGKGGAAPRRAESPSSEGLGPGHRGARAGGLQSQDPDVVSPMPLHVPVGDLPLVQPIPVADTRHPIIVRFALRLATFCHASRCCRAVFVARVHTRKLAHLWTPSLVSSSSLAGCLPLLARVRRWA